MQPFAAPTLPTTEAEARGTQVKPLQPGSTLDSTSALNRDPLDDASRSPPTSRPSSTRRYLRLTPLYRSDEVPAENRVPPADTTPERLEILEKLAREKNSILEWFEIPSPSNSPSPSRPTRRSPGRTPGRTRPRPPTPRTGTADDDDIGTPVGTSAGKEAATWRRAPRGGAAASSGNRWARPRSPVSSQKHIGLSPLPPPVAPPPGDLGSAHNNAYPLDIKDHIVMAPEASELADCMF